MPLQALLPYAPSAIKGLASAGKYIYNKVKNSGQPERPRFQDSRYGQDLLRLGREGISGVERNRRLSQVGRAAGTAAQRDKADYVARVKAEMGGAAGGVASQKGANTFDLDAARLVSSEAGQIAAESEAIKRNAKDRYGQLAYEDELAGYADKMARGEQDRANTNELISGVAGAAGHGLDTYLSGLKPDLDTDLKKANIALTKAKTVATLEKDTGFKFPAEFGTMDKAARTQWYVGQNIKDPGLMQYLSFIYDKENSKPQGE